MITFTRPDEHQLSELTTRLEARPLSYQAGLLDRLDAETRTGSITDGWFIDRFSAVIGHGAADFAAAEIAIRNWAMFDQTWTTTTRPLPTIKVGNVIGYGARVLGTWWGYGCRIIELIDEPRRFGFLYGTVSGHAERGEERFQVELLDNDDVVFSLLAASRPGRWFAWPGMPIARAAQRRFRPGAADGMRRAVEAHRATTLA